MNEIAMRPLSAGLIRRLKPGFLSVRASGVWRTRELLTATPRKPRKSENSWLEVRYFRIGKRWRASPKEDLLLRCLPAGNGARLGRLDISMSSRGSGLPSEQDPEIR